MLNPVLRSLFAVATLLTLGLAEAAYVPDNPRTYALNLPLEIPANASLAALELPLAAYEAMREPGLSDLRVFNALGERLPIAILPPASQTILHEGQAPLLPLPISTGKAGESIELSLLKDENGRLKRLDLKNLPDSPTESAPRANTWLADLNDFHHPLSEIEVQWTNGHNFDGHLKVELSSDLQHWSVVAQDAALLSVKSANGQLEQRRIAVRQHNQDGARYLRLHWTDDSQPPLLTTIKLISVDISPQPPRQWYALKAASYNKNGGFRYVSKALLPVRGVDLHFAETNTISNVTVSTRYYSDTPWTVAASGSVYRLGKGPLGEERNAPFLFKEYTHALWQLEFDPATAPKQAPELLLGWTPHRIVFPVRGPGPFVLAAGKQGEHPFHYAAGQLIPHYGTKDAPPVAEARILQTAGDEKNGIPDIPAAQAPSRETPAWAQPRNLILWGSLVAGVLLLAFMARSLLSQTTDKPADKD